MPERFSLLRKLATGGMAEVFLARQNGLERFEKLVVIKRILPHLAAEKEFVEMFLDEARTAADLRHPNVVSIFEVGRDGESYFMAMEYLQGQTLRGIQRSAHDAPLPLGLTMRVGADAARGLHHAHAKKDLSGRPLRIVHRDVSPQNIMVTYDGVTKIVDFGIAKAIGRSHKTATGMIRGKFEYMSPEQAAGGEVDARSDQFSLAVVLYETATGARLFRRDTDFLTLGAVVDCRVPPPSRTDPRFPPGLEAVLLRALSKDAGKRFPSCQALAEALEAFAADTRQVWTEAALSGWMKDRFAEAIRQEPEVVEEAALATAPSGAPGLQTRTVPTPTAAAAPFDDFEMPIRNPDPPPPAPAPIAVGARPLSEAKASSADSGRTRFVPALKGVVVPAEAGKQGTRPDEAWPVRPDVLRWMLAGTALLFLYRAVFGGFPLVDWLCIFLHNGSQILVGLLLPALGEAAGIAGLVGFPFAVVIRSALQRQLVGIALGLSWMGESVMLLGYPDPPRFLPHLLGMALLLASPCLVAARLFLPSSGLQRLRR